MRIGPLLAAFLLACGAATPLLAQGEAGPNPPGSADEAPVIVDPDRVGEQPPESPNDFRREFEDFVQIRGAWASDPEACASAEGSSGESMYLTDTIIRSAGGTCSIRNVETTGDTARVDASCTTGGDRSERSFTLRKTGTDTLSITSETGGQQTTSTLTRCPGQQ